MRKVIHSLVDDIDGLPAAGTVRFALDGVDYEIDLSSEHRERLLEIMDPYVVRARRLGRVHQARGVTPSAGPDLAYSETVRAWALEHGWNPASSGRLSKAVVAAYEETRGRVIQLRQRA